MRERIQELWEELNIDIQVNKREMVLGILVCLLAGILLGVFLSPRKRTMIGSYNGYNNTEIPEEKGE